MALFKISPDNPHPEKMRLLDLIVRHAIQPNSPLIFIMVNGPIGIGKSLRVVDQIKKENVVRPVPHKWIGCTTAAAIVQDFWEYREGGLLIADDAKSLFLNEDKDLSTVLKTALAPSARRLIAFASVESRRADAEIKAGNPSPPLAPSVFETKAQLIWLYNTDLDDKAEVKPAMRRDIAAFRDRAKAEINFSHDPGHALEYAIDLATTGGMLRGGKMKLTVTEANDAVRWFISNARRLKTISPRRLMIIGETRRDYPNDWQALLANTLFDSVPGNRVNMRLPAIPYFVRNAGRGFPLRRAAAARRASDDAARPPEHDPPPTLPVAGAPHACP